MRTLSAKYLAELFNLPVHMCADIRNLPTVSGSDTVSVVVNKMVRENIGAVIVVEQDQPAGLITEEDVLSRVVRTGGDLTRTTAMNVMSKPLIKIEHDRPMKEALELMRSHNIRRLPVMKEGALIGLVTERRLLEATFLVT